MAGFILEALLLMTRHRDSLVREARCDVSFEQLAAMALAQGLREKLASGELRKE